MFYFLVIFFCSTTTNIDLHDSALRTAAPQPTTSSRDGRARLPTVHGEPPTTAADRRPIRSSVAHGHALALDRPGLALCATAHGAIVAAAPPSHSAAAAGLALCVATAPATRPHYRRSLPGPGPGAAQPLRRQRRSTPASASGGAVGDPPQEPDQRWYLKWSSTSTRAAATATTPTTARLDRPHLQR